MLYICIPSRNEAPTVGLLLWKIRQVFTAAPREYQLLVGDDASTDATREVLAPYAKVLPLTILRQERHQGYARTVEDLLRHAVTLSDRPRRDAVVVLHADFLHDPATIPDLLKKFDSGADLVVAESEGEGAPTRGHRWLRRYAPLLLRRRVRVPGVRDTVSGFLAMRLSVAKDALPGTAPVLTAEGWAANAELIARAAAVSRKVEGVPTLERYDLLQRPIDTDPWAAAKALWRNAGELRLPLAAAGR
ncbi:MAG: glycosyltransferase family 2 protein [Gemmatimonadales bacterium]|nr:MAG: glycosyltransferase family 2 protein [Gemmatimonadales bacterium]